MVFPKLSLVLEEISDTAKVTDLLDGSALLWGNKTALFRKDESGNCKELTFLEFQKKAQSFAEFLKTIGIEEGDRVAVIEDNSCEWCIAFFGILYAGATAVLIDPRQDEGDYSVLIKKADPALILTAPTYKYRIPQAILKKIPVYNLQCPFQSLGFQPNSVKSSLADPSIACLVFTSGTGGALKAAALPHIALLFAVKEGVLATKMSFEDRLLNILPFSHVFGLVAGLLTPLSAGALTVIIPKAPVEEVIWMIKYKKITIMPAVPRVLEGFCYYLLNEVKKKKTYFQKQALFLISFCSRFYYLTGINLGKHFFSFHRQVFGGSLRLMVSGGAPLDPKYKSFLRGAGLLVAEGYGLTETAGILCCAHPSERAIDVVGKPPFPTIIKINSLDGKMPGEICVKGPVLMKEYFKDPESTKKAFSDGWFHSGDLGVLSNGQLKIIGRVKDMIVTSSGYKAFPEDVERYYRGMEGIKELAVFGMKERSSFSESIHAAVVLDDRIKTKCSEKQLQKTVEKTVLERSKQVPDFLHIQKLHIVSFIPKTQTLKVKLDALRKMLQKENNKHSKKPELTGDDISKGVIEAIYEVANRFEKLVSHPVSLGSSFQIDLGFDSLMSLELMLVLEKKFQLNFAKKGFARLETVRELVEKIKEMIKEEAS